MRITIMTKSLFTLEEKWKEENNRSQTHHPIDLVQIESDQELKEVLKKSNQELIVIVA